MSITEVWYSPAADCWRVEDGEMWTYTDVSDVIAHCQKSGAPALVNLGWPRAAYLAQRLRTAGIAVEEAR